MQVLVAGTVRELAESVGLPPRALEGELGRYNEDVLAGEDTRFGKSPVVMRTVAEPLFYATQMRLCNVSLTACGPRVDAASRVLDEGSQAIPGLYAGGVRGRRARRRLHGQRQRAGERGHVRQDRRGVRRGPRARRLVAGLTGGNRR